MPDLTTPPSPPQAVTPAPAANTDDRKPTGAFSRKKVYIAIGSVALGVFGYLIMFTRTPPPKPTTQQREREQNVERVVSTTTATAGARNYSNTVDQVVSKEALQAQEQWKRTGIPPAAVGATIPAQLQSLDIQGHPGSTPPRSAAGLHSSAVGSSAIAPTSRPDSISDGQSTIAADTMKREAGSFFAPLIVLTNSPSGSSQPAAAAHPDAQQAPSSPAATQPPMQQKPPADSAPKAPAPTPGPQAKQALQNAQNSATGPLHKLFEGTVIECVLTNRLNGTYTGPVNCMAAVDVWSHNGAHLLIPRGTRALGEAHKVSTTGQQRLALSFHRLIMPDGYSVSLDSFTGMNQIGETGLKDKVDNHYRQIFGVSIALGAIAGLSSRGTSYGSNQTGMDAWRQGVTQSTSQEATQILDRYLNILPTVIIREGTRVKVYLTDDLLLPAYAGHRMSTDL